MRTGIYGWHHSYSVIYAHVLLKVVPDLGRDKWDSLPR